MIRDLVQSSAGLLKVHVFRCFQKISLLCNSDIIFRVMSIIKLQTRCGVLVRLSNNSNGRDSLAVSLLVGVDDSIEELVRQQTKHVSMLQQAGLIPREDNLLLTPLRPQEARVRVDLERNVL